MPINVAIFLVNLVSEMSVDVLGGMYAFPLFSFILFINMNEE